MRIRRIYYNNKPNYFTPMHRPCPPHRTLQYLRRFPR